RQCGVVEHGFAAFLQLRLRGRRARCLGLAGRVAPGGPGVPCHQRRQQQRAQDDQAQCEAAHGVPCAIHAGSTRVTAASMSTATMRETPCSCMVTPISCSAISIAILLWLMKRNCVSLLMLLTSLA